MERVEAALKTSVRKEMALKSSPQSFFDDFWTVNAPNGVASDDFFVDELLDFSNEDGFVEEEEEKALVSVSHQEEVTVGKIDENPAKSSAENGLESVPASEFLVPAEDMESLEWLSHFVDDSFSEFSPSFSPGTLTANPKKPSVTGQIQEEGVQQEPCFKTPVPARARSKRTRTGCRVWSLGSPSFTESSSASSSSCSSSSPTSPLLIYTNLTNPLAILEPGLVTEKPPAKKPKRKPAVDGGAGGAQAPRRCSHCGVQKTPQWRTGPLGAKTLCNACGVRFKSGRLFPEYRPACSPTFSSELHSNHHRKVLEMRRKKETEMAGQAGQPSFEG